MKGLLLLLIVTMLSIVTNYLYMLLPPLREKVGTEKKPWFISKRTFDMITKYIKGDKGVIENYSICCFSCVFFEVSLSLLWIVLLMFIN